MSVNNDTGRLTTHVLDTASGRPAAGLVIELFRINGNTRDLLKTVTTNTDGRCNAALLEGEAFAVGEYELMFNAGDYFARKEQTPFLGAIPVRFGISNADEHYHVPLLVSPFGYSTYRGS